MASNSNSQSSQAAKEYIVRVPKLTRKKFHMMRFNADHGNDFFKSWGNCKIERENNFREYKMAEEVPKFGAGSEFGREQRDEARRKRYGINVRKYKSENQPWMLNVGGKNGKKFKGVREGGVAANAAWYVFMQGKDGAFEAYPVEEWYNFQAINRYKALSAEEAEEEFVRRDKIMNYFKVMYEKKFKKDGGEGEEEEVKKKGGSKKNLLLSEMDDWVSDEDDDEDEEDKMDDSDDGKSKKKKKHLRNKKSKRGGKKKLMEGREDSADDSCMEESDEYNEGVEHDYISGDSSDSDQENEEIVNKELAGVEEGDALKKLLASDDEDEDEKKKEGEEKDEEDKKKKRKKSDSEESANDAEAEDSSGKKKEKKNNLERKKRVNELKKKVKENPSGMEPLNKKMKFEQQAASNPDLASTSAPPDQMEEALRRYLLRKPMTTTQLLKQLKKKFDTSSEQLYTNIAVLLKKIKPNKRMIKGKMYLSLKPV